MFKTTETNVTTFNSAQFGDLRTHKNADGLVFFCLSDVANALVLEQVSRLKSRLNEKGVTIIKTPTNGGMQDLNFINEPNLYRCIFQSRKAEAEQFQNWVFEEVLPSIRKTGGYIATHADDTPELIMARALKVADEALRRQQEKLTQLQSENAEQQQQITLMLPKARVYDQVINTPADEWLHTTSAVANEIGMSAQKLNRMLCASGIIYRAPGGEYLFTAEYLRWNLGKAVSCVINEEKGRIRTYLKWNTRGRAYIHALNSTNWNKRRAWHLLKSGKEVVAL